MADGKSQTARYVALWESQWERLIEIIEWDTGCCAMRASDFDLAEEIRQQIAVTATREVDLLRRLLAEARATRAADFVPNEWATRVDAVLGRSP